MKTKITTLFVLITVAGFTSFSQINPIQNLQYEFFYGYPDYTYCPSYNCFAISWEVPATSADTLLGYRIYKNNVKWHFEDITYFECMGFSPCQYGDIYDSLPCVIKVRAVYNSDSIESISNDSVYIESIAIGIKELKKNEIILITNPIIKGELIRIEFPYNISKNNKVSIISLDGRLIQEISSNINNNNIIQIPSEKLNRGIYIIIAATLNQIMTEKLIIQ